MTPDDANDESWIGGLIDVTVLSMPRRCAMATSMTLLVGTNVDVLGRAVPFEALVVAATRHGMAHPVLGIRTVWRVRGPRGPSFDEC